MNARKFLMCFALSIGCSTGDAQSQGLVQSFLNGVGVGGLGTASSDRQRTIERAKVKMENAVRLGQSPEEACSKTSSNIPFAPYRTDQCLSDATAYEQSLEPARQKVTERLKEVARGKITNQGDSASDACRVALGLNSSEFAKSPYTQDQCETDMADVVAKRKENISQGELQRVQAQATVESQRPDVVEKAVQTALVAGSTDSSCAQALQSVSGISYETRYKLEDQCDKDMRPIYLERVRAASYKPLNCDQWAIKKGDAWRGAPVSMQYKPLAKSTGPAQFSGEIKNAEGTRLTVINDRFPAYVDVDPSTTMVFDGDKIQVGSVASGYGVISGKEEVQLTTGALMTIPVFKAACID